MIGVYQVYPVKKVTEDDPVNQECQVIPACLVFQVQEDQKVYLVVMDVMELKENLVDLDLMDSLVVLVNLVYLDKEDQKVNQHKLYLDLKAKLEKWDHLVFLELLVHLAVLVFLELQDQLDFLDVKVQKVNVVKQAVQVMLELDLVVQKVKKESQVHLLPIHHHLLRKYKVTTVMFRYQFLALLVKRVL